MKDKFDAPKTESAPDPKYVEAQNFWKKETPNVMKTLEKISITINAPVLGDGTKTEPINVDFKLSPKEQKAFAEFVEKRGADIGLKTPEEMVSKLKGDFIAHNHEKLFNAYAQRIISQRDEQWARKAGNYKVPGGKDASPASGIIKGSARELDAAMQA